MVPPCFSIKDTRSGSNSGIVTAHVLPCLLLEEAAGVGLEKACVVEVVVVVMATKKSGVISFLAFSFVKTLDAIIPLRLLLDEVWYGGLFIVFLLIWVVVVQLFLFSAIDLLFVVLWSLNFVVVCRGGGWLRILWTKVLIGSFWGDMRMVRFPGS